MITNDWKVNYALQFKDIEIDKNYLVHLIKVVIEDIKNVFDKLNIDKDITFDGNTNKIYFPGTVISIRIGADFSSVRFCKDATSKEVHIDCINGFYQVDYRDASREKINHVNLAKELIDSVFEYLLN